MTERALLSSKSFDEFKAAVRMGITSRCDEIIKEQSKPLCSPDPLLSAFILPCIERGRMLFDGGAKYCNMGAHGAGLSTAADAMTAIELGVFSGEIEKEELLAALKADFIGYEALRQKLLSYPKMGNDDDRADKNGGFLLECYAEGFKGKPSINGGIWRAGTGSAQSYISSSE